MHRRRPWLTLLIPLLAGACGTAEPTAQPVRSAVDALRASERDAAGFTRALAPRDLIFPDDHGPHPRFAVEWWYLTGSLDGPGGDRWGYQLTFFRRSLRPEPPAGRSAWATHQVYLAHAALTDGAAGRFAAAERRSRGALGLAGVTVAPFRAWIDHWQARSDHPQELFPLVLSVSAEDARDVPFGFELQLRAGKPRVLHGDRGLSRKGAAPGNASFYFSRTRMPTRGTVRLGDRTATVSGSSWLDREWSTSVLEPEQVGWDWLALQFADGRELMAFRLRRADGTVDPASHGTWIARDGSARHLARDQVEIAVRERWRGPRGVRYPSAWRVRVPSEGIDVDVQPVLADQELDLSFRYWEGAVLLDGGESGRGYVELVGYGEGLE